MPCGDLIETGVDVGVVMGLGDGVGLSVGVDVGDADGVAVGVPVGVTVGLGVCDGDGVGVNDGEGVGVGVHVAVGVGVGFGVAVGVGVGLGVGVGVERQPGHQGNNLQMPLVFPRFVVAIVNPLSLALPYFIWSHAWQPRSARQRVTVVRSVFIVCFKLSVLFRFNYFEFCK